MNYPNSRFQFRSRKKKKSRKLLILIAGSILLFVTVISVFVFRDSIPFIQTNEAEDVDLLALWNEGNYTLIIEECNTILIEEPMNGTALVLSGFSYFYHALSQNSLEEKIRLLDISIAHLRKSELVAEAPLARQVDYVLGKAYYLKGKFYADLAIQYLETALESGFINDDLYEYLGLSYSQIGDYENSIHYFLLALEENESDLLFHTLGRTYYIMENFGAAEEYLTRAVEITEDPELEEKCVSLLAEIYMNSEEYERAEEQYRRLLEIDPRSADVHFYLGELYEEIGDTVRARYEWREALRINPDHYGARLRYYQ
ncbi:MAG: tetratricopeptide repeat protein [Spirochaetia bacterium]